MYSKLWFLLHLYVFEFLLVTFHNTGISSSSTSATIVYEIHIITFIHLKVVPLKPYHQTHTHTRMCVCVFVDMVVPLKPYQHTYTHTHTCVCYRKIGTRKIGGNIVPSKIIKVGDTCSRLFR